MRLQTVLAMILTAGAAEAAEVRLPARSGGPMVAATAAELPRLREALHAKGDELVRVHGRLLQSLLGYLQPLLSMTLRASAVASPAEAKSSRGLAATRCPPWWTVQRHRSSFAPSTWSSGVATI